MNKWDHQGSTDELCPGKQYHLPSVLHRMAQAQRDMFLERAACFTAMSNHSTSAFLTSERLDSLAASNTAVSPMLKAICCLACGSPVILGRTSSTDREESTGKTAIARRGRKVNPLKARKTLVRTCELCHRKTTVAIPRLTKARESIRLAPTGSALVKTLSEEKSASKPTARQRAKDRKSKQALQVLIDSKSTQKAPKSSLDLMDFMKG